MAHVPQVARLARKDVADALAGLTFEQVEEVTEVKEKDGVYSVTLTTIPVLKGGGKGVSIPQWYEVTATKVSEGTDKPQVVFDLGAKAGESWTNESTVTVGA